MDNINIQDLLRAHETAQGVYWETGLPLSRILMHMTRANIPVGFVNKANVALAVGEMMKDFPTLTAGDIARAFSMGERRISTIMNMLSTAPPPPPAQPPRDPTPPTPPAPIPLDTYSNYMELFEEVGPVRLAERWGVPVGRTVAHIRRRAPRNLVVHTSNVLVGRVIRDMRAQHEDISLNRIAASTGIPLATLSDVQRRCKSEHNQRDRENL